MKTHYCTVVYQVVDEKEFAAVNPMHYAHNGLRAVAFGVGDALKRIDELESAGLPDSIKEAMNSGDGTYRP